MRSQRSRKRFPDSQLHNLEIPALAETLTSPFKDLPAVNHRRRKPNLPFSTVQAQPALKHSLPQLRSSKRLQYNRPLLLVRQRRRMFLKPSPSPSRPLLRFRDWLCLIISSIPNIIPFCSGLAKWYG